MHYRTRLLRMMMNKEIPEALNPARKLSIKPVHYLTFTGLNNVPTKITPGWNQSGVRMAYSIDNGTNWYEILSGESTVSSPKTLICGISATKRLYTYYTHNLGWKTSVLTNCSGEIMSLLLGTWNGALTNVVAEYAFAGMFRDNVNLRSCPSVYNVRTLANSAFREMFKGCTSIIGAPAPYKQMNVPANCCESMFEGCTSLTSAPALGANSVNFQMQSNCFKNMFKNCVNITSATVYWIDNRNVANYFSGWLSGITTTGTFYKSGEFWSSGSGQYPNTWTQKSVSSPYSMPTQTS